MTLGPLKNDNGVLSWSNTLPYGNGVQVMWRPSTSGLWTAAGLGKTAVSYTIPEYTTASIQQIRVAVTSSPQTITVAATTTDELGTLAEELG